MTEPTQKKILWKPPWSFAESAFIVTGIVLVGYALQLFLGRFKFDILIWPNNLFAGGILLFALFLLSLKSRSRFFQWLSGIPLTISLLTALVILTVIMGLTPQVTGNSPSQRTVIDILGFSRMTSSWPFVLVYFFTLVALGAVIAKRMKAFRWKDYPFYLNHTGLWIFLFAAGFGHADMRRYGMYVEEDTDYPEWRVYNDKNEVLELPLAIRLNDFTLDEYDPMLAVIDRKTGNAIPESKPEYLQLDSTQTGGKISQWEISIDKYLPQAVRNSDSTYKTVFMPGSCPAVKVRVKDKMSGKTQAGWVCCGNYAQLYRVIPLNAKYSLAMTRPEPKRFASDIEVYTRSGKSVKHVLEVNKPLTIDDWTIYQYGYDNEMGKASGYSSFELVYDPWLKLVYVGIILFASGSLCLFWTGRKKKGEVKDDHLE